MNVVTLPPFPLGAAGTAAVAAYSDQVDEWLTRLLAAVVFPPGVALVALGGYGRRELAPQSDLDLLLTYRKRLPEGLPDAIWYPIWDAGVKLGHSVRSVRDTLSLARDDLDTATALLYARPLLGDASLVEELNAAARNQWRKDAKRWLRELAGSVALRHSTHDDVAFAIEPDLKEGRGGLRDAHALQWAQLAGAAIDVDLSQLPDAVDSLTRVRVQLHLTTGRPGDRLRFDVLADVAAGCGDAGTDELMAGISGAARKIAWATDEFFYDVVERKGVRLDDPRIEPYRGRARFRATYGARDAEAALRVALAAAQNDLRIDARSLDELRPAATDPPRWSPTLRALLVSLLACGRSAIPAIEALDHAGVWTALFPEWSPARSRPQHNPYHGYTVDRHLLETVAQAATLPTRREDLLLMGALLHDLGKAYPGDHSEVGAELVPDILGRMGWTDDDIETVTMLVRHHLLLPDTATRRDLDDPSTLRAVAAIVQRSDRLDLLACLAEADGRATGPTAWSRWKAQLVDELVRRVHVVLHGTAPRQVVSDAPLKRVTIEELGGSPGEIVVRGEGESLVVGAPDRPGLFSRICGAVALHGLDIRSARISSIDGAALDELVVAPPGDGEVPWERVAGDVRLAVEGRLAITARLAARASSSPQRRVMHSLPTDVRVIEGDTSDTAIVEVVGPDSIGVLYRLACAFAELGLDITRAMVSTVGNDIVDAFYVRDPGGFDLASNHSRAELQRALTHALGGTT